MGMMAVLNSQQQQLWVKLGMGTISPSQGLNILERVLFSSATQIGVLPVNWPVYLQSLAWVEHPPLLDEIAQEIQTRSPAEQLSSPAPKLLEQLAVAAPDEHLGLVLAHLCQQVTRVLRLNSGQLIDPHLPLLNFGLDSLMAIELRNQIKAELSIEVPVVNFLQGQSLAQIAAEVLSQLQSGSSREADSEILSEPATDNEWEVLTL
jgi:acyl carrier protein